MAIMNWNISAAQPIHNSHTCGRFPVKQSSLSLSSAVLYRSRYGNDKISLNYSDKRSSVVRCGTADPLDNRLDSFGNECLSERKAHLKLMANDTYRKVISSLSDRRSELEDVLALEDYSKAAELQNAIDMLEFRKRLLEMSSKPRVLYRVGDVVAHKAKGYRGVIYGHDNEYAAPADWINDVDVASLKDGLKQPFYHILVDCQSNAGCLAAYISQEELQLKKMAQPIDHPWISRFFVGFQGGTYFPVSKLRAMYPNDW